MSRIYLSRRDCKLFTICVLALGISLFPLAKAHAQVPATAADNINFLGGIEAEVALPANDAVTAFEVPPGVNYLITDVIVANFDATDLGCMEIFEGPCQGATCDSSVDKARTNALVAAPEDTLVVGFNTGIGFASGSEVTLQSCRDVDLWVTIRGYRFTLQ